MDINITKRYNKRHKIVIGILAVLAILIQYLPYKAVFDYEKVDHKECVEISKLPECSSEKEYFAYEINANKTVITKTQYKSCYEYYTSDKMVSSLPEFLQFIGMLIVIVDIAVAVCFVLWLIYELIVYIYKLLKDNEDEE